jgi:glycosyltransferase involved in cell wall biosynthesis
VKLALITDAWHPQVNGVVTTLHELVEALGPLGVEVTVLHPGLFKNRPCPGYAGIQLAVRPYQALATMLDSLSPDAVHIATEGPLGWAARKHCIHRGWRFTTAFHTKFPEILRAALRVPLFLGYALFRRFHRPSSGVMVPTEGVLKMLQARGFQSLKPWTHGVDLSLFSYQPQAVDLSELQHLPRPWALYVGRVSYEKNIDAFLSMPWSGTRIVCGEGPLANTLKAQFPNVVWMGVLPRQQLATVYASADVFVFPSRHETFGLVMLEAMASGSPVAAYPVDGPLQVLGAEKGQTLGGVLAEDLHDAAVQALQVPRQEARRRAESFGWPHTVALFKSYLMPIKEEVK